MARPANPGLRNEILKAAASIIEECGPDCVTMRQVADQIGYSPTTIYNHFKDKGDVLCAAVHAALADLADSCDVASVGPRALDMLRQRSRAYVVWGIMHPGHYRLIFDETEDIEYNADDFAMMRTVLSWQRTLAEQAVSDGELSAECDPAAFAQALWAALHGATSLTLSGRLAGSAGAGASAPVLAQAATATADRLLNSLIADCAT